MSWVKLDDAFTEHPKTLKAGPSASWQFVSMLCWSARYLTDGHLPAALVQRVPVDDVKRLLDVGFVAECPDHDECLCIPSYLEYQPSADVARAKSEARRTAGQLGGMRSGRRRREANAEANASADAQANGEQTGSKPASTGSSKDEAKSNPVPVPSASNEAKARARVNTWGKAWDRVRQQIRSHGLAGAAERPRLDDLSEAALKAAGGFASLCRAEEVDAKMRFRESWLELNEDDPLEEAS